MDMFRRIISVGYCVIVVIIGVIAYIYMMEWEQMDVLENQTSHLNELRQNIHNAYSQMLDLTLYGENNYTIHGLR